MPTIETRIRTEAASKIRVRITGRSRSKNGFDITFAKLPDNVTASGGYRKNVPSKREAMAHLLTVLRCMSPIEISIAPAKRRFKLGPGGICDSFACEMVHAKEKDPVCYNCGSHKSVHPQPPVRAGKK